jgi:hypothetical protein
MLRVRGGGWAATKPIVNGVGTDIRVGPDHQAGDRKGVGYDLGSHCRWCLWYGPQWLLLSILARSLEARMRIPLDQGGLCAEFFGFKVMMSVKCSFFRATTNGESMSSSEAARMTTNM